MTLPEMNADHRTELQSRTTAIKGFSKDAAIDDILKFFRKHGEVGNVIMRKFTEQPIKRCYFKYLLLSKSRMSRRSMESALEQFQGRTLPTHTGCRCHPCCPTCCPTCCHLCICNPKAAPLFPIPPKRSPSHTVGIS